MNRKILEILVCPVCKGPLVHRPNERELVCKADRLAFPIIDDIPVMLVDEARDVPAEDLEKTAGR